jgi:hypothetical protein
VIPSATVGFSDVPRCIIEYVDISWLGGDFIVKLFGAESTTIASYAADREDCPQFSHRI